MKYEGINKKQEQIYKKCERSQRKKQTIKDYAKVCVESDVCPVCGDLLRFVSGVLEDECCAGNTALMGVYMCSSSRCNFLFGNGDRESVIAGHVEFTDGKKLLSRTEKRRIRIAEKIDDTYWAAPIEYV